MRTCILLLFVSGCMLARLPAGENDALRAVLEAKLKVIEKGRDLAQRAYDSGVGNADDVFVWTERALKTRMELAKTRDERNALAEEYITRIREMYEIQRARVLAGQGTEMDSLKAELHMLDAEQFILEMRKKP